MTNPFDNLTLDEDVALYESGLVAHGCLDELDLYQKEAIIRYGRILLMRLQEKQSNSDQTKLD